MNAAAVTVAATDLDLLREFVRSRSESAFASLVRRHLDLVYATALRRTSGNASLAEEASQQVFIALAREAGRLSASIELAGWLHRRACFVTANLLRTEARRHQREQVALQMQMQHQTDNPDWVRLAPLLDEALLELSTPDRVSLVLRFLEQQPFAEIGARLGLHENAARMRVERALEKLRVRLAKRGVTSTASALAVALGGPALATAPAGMASAITAAALATASFSTTTGLIALMASTKLKFAAAVVGLGLLGTATWQQYQTATRLRAEKTALEARLAQANAELAAARAPATSETAAREYQRALQEEVLRLRNEVAQSRRGKGTTPKPAAPPAPKAASTTQPPRPYANFSPQFQAQVAPGETLVSGGWSWTGEKNSVVFMTPTIKVGDNGERQIQIESRIAFVPDSAMAEFGLSGFGSADAKKDAHGILPAGAGEALLAKMAERSDIGFVPNTAQMVVASGAKGGVAVTETDNPDAICYDLIPTLTDDGRISLSVVGRTEPIPQKGD